MRYALIDAQDAVHNIIEWDGESAFVAPKGLTVRPARADDEVAPTRSAASIAEARAVLMREVEAHAHALRLGVTGSADAVTPLQIAIIVRNMSDKDINHGLAIDAAVETHRAAIAVLETLQQALGYDLKAAWPAR